MDVVQQMMMQDARMTTVEVLHLLDMNFPRLVN